MSMHPLRNDDARKLGVIIALPAEARSFDAARGSTVEVAVVGPGPRRAEAGARALIELGVGALLSWGTSGALIEALPAGQLLLGETTRDAQGRDYAADAAWLASAARVLAPLAPRRTRCVTVERPVSNLRAKTLLARDTGGEAVDMESAAVAAAADGAGLPFLAIRSIVDPVDCDLPRCVMAGMDMDGETHLPRLLGALLRRPWELGGLLRLAVHFNASLRALRGAASLLASSPTGAA